MKAIFNSLGSNYDLGFCSLAIKKIFKTDVADTIKLRNFFKREFNGDVFFFYKGRDAIEFILQQYKIGKLDSVLTQAFACYAIEEAINRVGAKVCYVDLEKESLHPSINNLEKAYRRAINPKAVIIQHTLGYAEDIIAISKWCKEKNLILVEDLAQSYGAKDRNGEPLGRYSDAIAISFGKGKVLDSVSGGVAILKNKISNAESCYRNINDISKKQVIKDLIYPYFTYIIRQTYRFGLGKLLSMIARFFGIISSSVKSENCSYKMPDCYSALVLYQIKELKRNIKHRRKVGLTYQEKLDSKIVSNVELGKSVCLRFPLVVKNPQYFVDQMKKKGIYLEDRWYKSPVDCGSMTCKTNYVKGSCLNAELLSKSILNLPTHIAIEKADVLKIIKVIGKLK